MQIFDGITLKMTCLRLRKCAGNGNTEKACLDQTDKSYPAREHECIWRMVCITVCQPKAIKVEQTNFEFHRNATHISGCYLVFNNRAQEMNCRLQTSHTDISHLSICCLSSVLITYAVHLQCYINCNDYKHK